MAEVAVVVVVVEVVVVVVVAVLVVVIYIIIIIIISSSSSSMSYCLYVTCYVLVRYGLEFMWPRCRGEPLVEQYLSNTGFLQSCL